MPGDVINDTGECPDTNGIVHWHRNMMLSIHFCSQADMASALPNDDMGINRKFSREFVSINVSRNSHEAITCSRT